MPEFFTNPSLLTKERLKATLEENGILLPRSEQKKDFYVNLYLKHLTPRNTTDSPGKADFYSSDEEETTPRRRSIRQSLPRNYKAPKREKELPFDVFALSDGDLARQLRVFGVNVGPITNSTRPVYQKRLMRLLTDEARNPPPKPAPAEQKISPLPKKEPEPESYSADEIEEESGDAAEDEAMEVDENSVEEKDEQDALPINRNSFARRRYAPPKSVPQPEPVAMPTRRSLRGKANQEEVVKTSTQKEVKKKQERMQDEEGDGIASAVKFILFAIASVVILGLLIYFVMEGNPPNPEQLDSPPSAHSSKVASNV